MPIIREKRQTGGVGPVGVVRMNTGEVEKYNMISEAAGQVTKYAINEMSKVAEASGEAAAQQVALDKIVTINPETGKPEAVNWIGENRFFGRTAAQAYERVVQDRFQLSIENEIKMKASEIALKFKDNPYGVERYEEQMTEYLKSMALGSEQNGKATSYTNFILNEGAQYIAATKINMMQRRNALERAKAAQALEERNIQDIETAYTLGVQGRSATIEPFIGAAEQRTFDGEEAAVLPRGTTSKQQMKIQTAYAQGSLQRIFRKASSDDAARDGIILAIRTGGLASSAVPAEYREDLASILPYINRSNADSLLTFADKISSDYKAVNEADRQAAKAEAKRNSRATKIALENSATFSSAFYMQTLTNQASSGNITAAMGSFDSFLETTEGQIGQVRQQYIDGIIEESEMDERTKDLRQAFLDPVILSAASDGNISQLKAAINSGNPEDLSDLSVYQREIVMSLRKSNMVSDNRSYINSLLEGSENDVRIRSEEVVRKLSINNQIEQIADRALKGPITVEEYEQGVSLLLNSTLHSATEIQNGISILRANAAKGIYNSAGNMTAAEANALNLYIATEGADNRDLPEHLLVIGDKILNVITPNELDKIKSHGSAIESGIRQEEAARIQRVERQQNYARVESGAGYSGVAADRKLMDEVLRTKYGVDFANPQTLLDENGSLKAGLIPLMQRTVPEGLVKRLEAIHDGLPTQNADMFLDLFANLSNTVSANGVFVDRFGSSMSIATKAFLTDVNDIRSTVGGNPVEIAETLRARRNDPVSKNVMEAVLGKKSPYEYTLKKTEDPYVASRLSAAVEYYARTGRDASTIDRAIDDLVEKHFPRVDYIADPRMPLGSLVRSENSLQSELNDAEEVREFVRIINEQLPSGYVLQSAKERNAVLSSGAYAGLAGAANAVAEAEAKKQVLLVPDRTSGLGKTTFFAYYVDENKELQPLIIDKPDGSKFFVAFDDSELDGYRSDKRAQEELEIKEALDQQERLREALSKRPGLRAADVFGD